MNEEQRDWIATQWSKFRQEGTCTPSLDEWQIAVTNAAAADPGCPLLTLDYDTRRICAEQAFEQFQIEEARGDEIATKDRYAKINAENRRYVDGSF